MFLWKIFRASVSYWHFIWGFYGSMRFRMCSFQDNLAKLNDSNATVLGISVDSPWANAEFASKYNLDFDLLSDIDGDVVEAYDAKFVGLGGIDGYTSANRVVIVIDKRASSDIAG